MSDAVLNARLDYVEAQLVKLVPGYVPHSATVDAGVPQTVIDLVRQGKKIAAIAAYRELTGLGLKEAKDVIDRL